MYRPQDFAGANDWPFAVGEVTGVRGWRVRQDGLYPLHVSGPEWQPGENTATCRLQRDTATWSVIRAGLRPSRVTSRHDSPRHDSPDEGCKCGFYAYDEEKVGLEFMLSEGLRPEPVVFGKIRGYGRTLIGEKGFRCEKAEVTAFFRWPTAGVLYPRELPEKWREIPWVVGPPVVGSGWPWDR